MINPVIKLQKEFNTLKEFAIEHKKEFTNEEITKQVLILPFLKALGYDTKNPKIVKAEYSPANVSNSFKVDYCILNKEVPSIFVEAKTYGRNLAKYVEQIEKYFNGSPSSEVGILTNGTEYQFSQGMQVLT